eukprot:2671788-Lingulodinium_polyedra.AAC.1
MAQSSMLGVLPMPMLRASLRSGPSLLPTRAATLRPQMRARVMCRTHFGASHPSRTAASH